MTRVANTLTCLSTVTHHELRRIQNEPQTLLFLEDIWIGHITSPLIQRVKETFFAVIEASKGHPEYGAAAANAITMLNWMGTMLMKQEIQVPGANLAYAQLRGSDLSHANLQGARLFRANLQDANLVEANLTNIDFLERAPITIGHTCEAIAYHPTKPWIVIADRNNVRQYDTERGTWVGEPLTGHTDRVTSISYSPLGAHLVSAGRRICVWNSGVTGDFSLMWCTRTGANLLVTTGLRLSGVLGLRADQRALLAYAGCQETNVIAAVISPMPSLELQNQVDNETTYHSPLATAQKALKLGRASYNHRDYAIAREYATQALAIYRVMHGESADQADIADALFNLGKVYYALNDYSNSLNYYTQALTMMQTLHGDKPHCSIAETLYELGKLHKQHNKVDLAKINFQQALSIYQTFPEDFCEREITLLQNELSNLSSITNTPQAFYSPRSRKTSNDETKNEEKKCVIM